MDDRVYVSLADLLTCLDDSEGYAISRFLKEYLMMQAKRFDRSTAFVMSSQFSNLFRELPRNMKT